MARTSLFVLFGMAAATLACGGETLVPPSTTFAYNENYPLKTAAGRYGWFCGVDRMNGGEIMFQLGQLDELAAFSLSPLGKSPAARNPEHYQHRRQLFRDGGIPLTGPNFRYYVHYTRAASDLPGPEALRDLAGRANFLGYRAFNEWGTGLDRMIDAHVTGAVVNTSGGRGAANLAKELFKDFPRELNTREEFEAMAAHAWNTLNAPFEFQTYVLDGSHYWAKPWPGGWNPIRAIITENRVPYRSNTLMQSITRGSARMWGVPYGYLSAYDWSARIGHPVYSHMQAPRPNYQNQQGVLKINPNLYRRLWYYMAMGNAAILADESDHARYADYAASGQYRYNWYGELVEEVRDFIRLNPDLGVQWNPVALALSWHNGVVYRGDKAFYRFPYNDGEHMARELLHRVIFNFSEEQAPMDEFAPMPFGDLFDVLRLDTPKGPLRPEFLENYKVLFLVGEQKFTPDVVQSLKTYTEKGGILIANARHAGGDGLADDFLGAAVGLTPAVATQMLSKLDGQTLASGAFTYSPLRPGPRATVLYTAPNGDPLVVRAPFGKGHVITVGAHWLLENDATMRGNILRRTMLPLAGDLLKNLMPALVPFRLEGDHVAERVLFQANRKGEGWVVSLFNNAGRRAGAAAKHGYMGPDIVDINQKVDLRLVLPETLAHVVELTSGEKCYPAARRGEWVLELSLQPGDLRIVEAQPAPIPDRMATRPVNLARGKKVTASSFVPRHEPEKAVDGDEDFMAAWWSKDACPEWLMVDLGEIATINSIRTVLAWSEDHAIFPRINQYTVEVGKDGETWTPVVDESKNIQPDTQRGLHRFFKPTEARYVRLNMLFNASRQGAQVVEFQVFGPTRETVAIPWKTDPAKAVFPASMIAMRTRAWLSDEPLAILSKRQDEKTWTYDKECHTGEPIRIRGREFAKGLGSHANSEIVYALDPGDGWKLFTAHVGIDDVSSPVGTVDFQVWVDGRLAARSGKLTMREQAIPIWADLAGAKELKLVIDDCGDGIAGDIACWGEASIRK